MLENLQRICCNASTIDSSISANHVKLYHLY